MIREHPNLELAAVGSRELAGKPVPGFDISYTDISAANVGKVDADCWVMALPNGYAAPFFKGIRERPVTGTKQVIVDLSADQRFDSTWTYGLVERCVPCVN